MKAISASRTACCKLGGRSRSRSTIRSACDALTFGDRKPVLSVEQDSARNTALGLALVGMARDPALADLNAVRTGIGMELRKLYSGVLREKIPDRMAELIKQLD